MSIFDCIPDADLELPAHVLPQHVDDSVFWDRVAGMPYAEALMEFQGRRQALIDERAAHEQWRDTKRWDGKRDQVRAAQLTRITAEIKRINEMRNRLQWKDAILALYGQDGYSACAEWIAQRDGRA